jgi:hypothetical protein
MVQEEMAQVKQELDKYLEEFNAVLKTDVPGFNKVASEKGAGTLFAGNPIEIKAGSSDASGAGSGTPDDEDDQ